MMQSNLLIQIIKIMPTITKKFTTLKSLTLILLLFVTGTHYSSLSIAQSTTKTIMIEPKFYYFLDPELPGDHLGEFSSPDELLSTFEERLNAWNIKYKNNLRYTFYNLRPKKDLTDYYNDKARILVWDTKVLDISLALLLSMSLKAAWELLT